MKISNSKKELAKIIHENGGWRDIHENGVWREQAESAAQCAGGEISFWHDTATKQPGKDWCGSYLGKKHDIEFTGVKLPNWHQTILSRDEYFHLYPAPDADGWIEWNGGECPVEGDERVVCKVRSGKGWRDGKAIKAKVLRWYHTGGIADIISYRLHKPAPEIQSEIMGIAQVGDINVVESKPTIEQLAADYRNRKDYADRKQQEADAAKADAEAKLAELVAAGNAHGLVLSVAEQEPELVIADWRDLQERDVIWFCGDDEQGEGEYSVLEVEHRDYGGQRAVRIDTIGNNYWIDVSDGWKFIRRP